MSKNKMIPLEEVKILKLFEERFEKSVSSLPCLVSIDTINLRPPLICLIGKDLTEHCIVPLTGENPFVKYGQNEENIMRPKGALFQNIKFEIDLDSFSALEEVRTEKYGALVMNGTNLEIIVKANQGIFDSRVIIQENFDNLTDFPAVFGNWQITTEVSDSKQILWSSTKYNNKDQNDEKDSANDSTQ